MHAQILLFDGFDPLDVVAPFEVLAAGQRRRGGHVARGTRLRRGAAAGGERKPRPRPRRHRASGPREAGYVVVPGASGPPNGDPDDGAVTIPVLLARFSETAAVPLMRQALANPDVTVATVCGGSLALAMAGLLEGRHAATHHLGMDVLEATGVNIVHARVVDEGDLITAGGVTSGLELALYLLERGYGPRVALTVESLFAYERRGTVWA